MINSLFKKFSSFAKITVTILSLFGNSSLAQSADLRFADIIKNGTSYIVNIEIKGIPAFKFGTSNITFNFNHDVLSSPVLDSAYNYSGGTYNLITVTNPLPGVRKSTRLNSSHLGISYAVFCLKKKIRTRRWRPKCIGDWKSTRLNYSRLDR